MAWQLLSNRRNLSLTAGQIVSLGFPGTWFMLYLADQTDVITKQHIFSGSQLYKTSQIEPFQSVAAIPLSFPVVLGLILQSTEQYVVWVLFRATRFNHIEGMLLTAHAEQWLIMRVFSGLDVDSVSFYVLRPVSSQKTSPVSVFFLHSYTGSTQ